MGGVEGEKLRLPGSAAVPFLPGNEDKDSLITRSQKVSVRRHLLLPGPEPFSKFILQSVRGRLAPSDNRTKIRREKTKNRKTPTPHERWFSVKPTKAGADLL